MSPLFAKIIRHISDGVIAGNANARSLFRHFSRKKWVFGCQKWQQGGAWRDAIMRVRTSRRAWLCDATWAEEMYYCKLFPITTLLNCYSHKILKKYISWMEEIWKTKSPNRSLAMWLIAGTLCLAYESMKHNLNTIWKSRPLCMIWILSQAVFAESSCWSQRPVLAAP